MGSPRVVFIYTAIAVITTFTLVIALTTGDESIRLRDAINAVVYGDNELHRVIVTDIRIPRILMALLIGMLLAQTGVITQNVFSNPIADPFIIGIASAATFGAVIGYLFRLDDSFFGIIGFVSCSIFSLIIYRISRYTSITTLLIIGMAISSFMAAFTSFAMYYIGEQSFRIVAWLMGYLGLASNQKVILLGGVFVVSSLYFFSKRNELNILLCGEDEARNMGVDARRLKNVMLIISSLAVSFSVAFTGIIGFIGLIVPHAARMLAKNFSNSVVLPMSTLMGGCFLLICDTLSRTLMAPVEIPVGVITSFFGAPFFVYLAIKAGRNM